MFASNLGNGDRLLRILLGLVLLAVALLLPDVAYASVGWVGVVPLVTGFIGWCALYRLLGVSTRKRDRAQS